MTVANTLWAEKHRPERLEEIAGHGDTIDRLQRFAQDEETPHMLFAGPPGTGKTTAITAFAREVFGDTWRNNLHEMNASDERGIDTIRDKAKAIARSKPAGGADYQIIFLDESDHLTKDAQASLRRTMEQYSDVTRFFLTCNYKNQIIGAIQSRCANFRFAQLNEEDVEEILRLVAEKEGISVEDGAIELIAESSIGDARTALNNLQVSVIDGSVALETVEEVIGKVEQEVVSEVVDKAIRDERDDAMKMLDSELLKAGANTNTIADAFLRELKTRDFPGSGERLVFDKLSEVDWRVRQGANPNVQWHSFIQDVHAAYHADMGGKY